MVSACWSEPSAFITHTWAVPVRLLRNAIFVPSGLYTGNWSMAGDVVSWVGPVPSRPMVQMSGLVKPAGRPPKTTESPDGAKSGNVTLPPRSVTRRWSVPFCFITQMSAPPWVLPRVVHQAMEWPSGEYVAQAS